MKIGELATRAGVSPRLVQYFEQQELLAPMRQSTGTDRVEAASSISTQSSLSSLSSSQKSVPASKCSASAPMPIRDAIRPPARRSSRAVNRRGHAALGVVVRRLEQGRRLPGVHRRVVKEQLGHQCPHGSVPLSPAAGERG